MGIGKKLQELIEERKTNINALAVSANVSPQTIYSLIRRDASKVEIDSLIKISRALGVNAEYFSSDSKQLTEPELLKSEQNINLLRKYSGLDNLGKEIVNYIIDKELERSDILKEDSIADKTRSIIHIENLVSAGTGKFIIDDMPPNLIEIPDIPDYKNASYAITVSGDSMEPDFYDGDIVLVEKRSSIDSGDIGIFVIDNEGFIKKCCPDGLVSLNTKYDIIKPVSEVICMGRVIGKL